MTQLLKKSEDRQLESDALNLSSFTMPSFLIEASDFGSVTPESSRYDFLAPAMMAEIDDDDEDDEEYEEEDGDEEEYDDDEVVDDEEEGEDDEEEGEDDEYEEEDDEVGDDEEARRRR